MFKYNHKTLREFKNRYSLTYIDIKNLIGLKSKESVRIRLNNHVPLTAKEIELICNYSERQEAKKDNNNTKPFTPNDFYTVY